ncbi:MAG TPA: dihydroneopterin aldolase [Sphingobium sp.]|jgi:dihydroneopterin aldolase|uniref:dihydroneopterin aldolase n=1 Tax=unclassified Sphingobium TaxID=2611147 RepID=UPI0007F44852|nr:MULTISPECIES: dihydroneopterin aldolase [unclassified Sphingobium]OAN59418.1 dihydroneopterin aldolase [Sphingobium sp. TCM1]HAF42253.1 dihydroneopterin aldolase [Sphingobium sp.]
MGEPQYATRVRVRDLPLLADIGINPDEIGRRQPLVISVELLLSADRVDGIAETVDYRRVAQAAEDLALVHIPLIETFAQRLGERCLDFSMVVEARVSVDKPFALTRGLAGVEVVVRR